MLWTAIASLTPAALLAAACVFGGVFPGLALLSMTVVVFVLDRIPFEVSVSRRAGRVLSLCLGLLHFPVLFLGIWAIAAGAHLETLDKVLIFITLGFYAGQVSNSNAHELIHTAARPTRRLGTAVYTSLLNGHHVSAHLRVHHVHAATDQDPNSAPKGQGFWAFAWRAAHREFIAGWHADNAQRARTKGPLSLHPYALYLGGGAVALATSWLIAGPAGVVVHLGLATHAYLQLLMSDYVQHYGLRRATHGGKTMPIGPQHSWNAPHWYSGAMLLNAPKHSDHHQHPGRAFPDLEIIPETMPTLPRSLPVMAGLAMVPRLWRRVMDHRVDRWRDTA